MTEARVLVADDNADLRDMLRLSLGLAGGFEVVAEAGDAWAAVAAVEVAQPDVVLVDLLMPGRDDVDVIAEIRRRQPETGIVVLTGWVVEGDRDRVLASGASEYLVKAPDLMASLVPALRRAALHRVGADVER